MFKVGDIVRIIPYSESCGLVGVGESYGIVEFCYDPCFSTLIKVKVVKHNLKYLNWNWWVTYDNDKFELVSGKILRELQAVLALEL